MLIDLHFKGMCFNISLEWSFLKCGHNLMFLLVVVYIVIVCVLVLCLSLDSIGYLNSNYGTGVSISILFQFLIYQFLFRCWTQTYVDCAESITHISVFKGMFSLLDLDWVKFITLLFDACQIRVQSFISLITNFLSLGNVTVYVLIMQFIMLP